MTDRQMAANWILEDVELGPRENACSGKARVIKSHDWQAQFGTRLIGKSQG
jgi:hypothetical protein